MPPEFLPRRKKYCNMHRHYKTTVFFSFVRVVSDVLCVLGGFFLAYYLRFYSGYFSAVRVIPPLYHYQMAFPVGTILVLFFFKSYDFYRSKWRYNFLKEFFLIIRGVTSGLFILLALGFFYREFSYSRGLVLLVWPSSIILLATARWFLAKFEVHYLQKKKIVTRLAIIGHEHMAARLYECIRRNPILRYQTEGFIVDDTPAEELKALGVPILGGIYEFSEILDRVKLDEVVLTRQNIGHEKIMALILECEKRLITFKLVPDVFEIMTSHVDITHVDGIPLLGFHEFPLRSAWSRFLKRQVDIAGSLTGLALLGPVMALVAVLIKRDSPGPVFYKQERCGEDGRVFKIFKFRTMIVGAEEKTGPVWAKPDDERRTRLGTFLRRYNLDELPQLINVFRGDMSLVGPRPERPHFVDKFKEDVPRYMFRHYIKSGVTGWAQVNGLRGDTSIEERIKYDLYYIEHWSLFFDFKILLMTLFARKNAY